MSKIIMTNGWPSMKAWADAGYPGAVKRGVRTPNPRSGLCLVPNCESVEQVHGKCLKHYQLDSGEILRMKVQQISKLMDERSRSKVRA